MAAQTAAASDRALFSYVLREYRASLALFVAGIVLIVALTIYSLWASVTGNSPTTLAEGLAMQVVGTAGFMLVLLAGTVAYYHRKFLRETWRKASP
jgi:uncharacterized membrane protein